MAEETKTTTADDGGDVADADTGMPRHSTEIWAYPLPLGDAYIQETRAYHLTLADVKALQHGDVVELTLFHRNVWDPIIKDDLPENAVLRAADVFNGARATYVHDGGVKGTITHHSVGKKGAPKPFTWQVEYDTENLECWQPIHDNGKVYGDDSCELPGSDHWTELPPTTRVGWRGPCVRTAFLAFMPNMFHVSSKRASAGAVRHRRVAAPEAEAKAAAIEDAAAIARYEACKARRAATGCRVYASRARSLRQTVTFPDTDDDDDDDDDDDSLDALDGDCDGMIRRQ